MDCPRPTAGELSVVLCMEWSAVPIRWPLCCWRLPPRPLPGAILRKQRSRAPTGLEFSRKTNTPQGSPPSSPARRNSPRSIGHGKRPCLPTRNMPLRKPRCFPPLRRRRHRPSPLRLGPTFHQWPPSFHLRLPRCPSWWRNPRPLLPPAIRRAIRTA
jgi:hypothetical protein